MNFFFCFTFAVGSTGNSVALDAVRVDGLVPAIPLPDPLPDSGGVRKSELRVKEGGDVTRLPLPEEDPVDCTDPLRNEEEAIMFTRRRLARSSRSARYSATLEG